jgi:hypothetical protein
VSAYAGEWILILFMSIGNAGGPVTATFSDKAACDLAMKNLTGLRDLGYKVIGTCTPKNVDAPH